MVWLLSVFGIDISSAEHRYGPPLMFWAAFGAAFAFSSTLGKTEEHVHMDPATGASVVSRTRHTLFFIPVRFWSYLLGLFCVFVTIVFFATGPADPNPTIASSSITPSPEVEAEEVPAEPVTPADAPPAATLEAPSPAVASVNEPPVPTPPSPEPASSPAATDAPASAPMPASAPAPVVEASPSPPSTPMAIGDAPASVPGSLSTGERLWTDHQGRTMTAALLSVTSEEPRMARFRKADGSEYSFPVAKLSDADRALVLAQP